MDIEIITTKKKLTKSIVNQMPFRVFKNFDEFEVLGLLRNIRTGVNKTLLCKHNIKGYFLLNMKYWIFDDGRYPTEVKFNGRAILSFENEQSRNDWWNTYKLIISTAKQIYI